jgi:hypothetical protein
MQDQLAVIGYLPEGFSQHVYDLAKVGAFRQGIADDLSIEEIHNRGKIELLP